VVASGLQFLGTFVKSKGLLWLLRLLFFLWSCLLYHSRSSGVFWGVIHRFPVDLSGFMSFALPLSPAL